MCAPGWTGSPGACTQCPIGTYKTALGEGSCVPCPSHSNTSQSGQSSCWCTAGYAREGGAGGACVSCGVGTYKERAGDGDCTSCDAGSYSLEIGATSASKCLECTAGKYSMGVGVPCQDCPANSMSAAGSTGLSDCSCKSGYTGTDGGTCTACVEGTYKMNAGSGACLECGSGKYSGAVGATGESACSTCPANSDAPGGSTSAVSCRCNAGFTGADGGTCTACVEGTYPAIR